MLMKIRHIDCNHNICFKSYNKLNSKTNMSVSTSFYNDSETLVKAVDLIEAEFPKGTEILVYAGSNGEEAISIYSMLKNPDNYHIYSIDPFKDAIDYAKKGIYAVHLFDKDGFLQEKKENESIEKTFLREKFNNTMVEIPKPVIPLNNMQDTIYTICCSDNDFQKYYKLKESVQNNIKYVEGDIKDISNLTTKESKVGAVFFRNALYQITNNDLTGVLRYGDAPVRNTYKLGVLRHLVENIDKKLCIGGFFVMGDHLQEHLYLADKYTKIKDSIYFDKKRNLRYMLQPPHIKALQETGDFQPVFYKEIENFGAKMPLIWQKIK